VSLPAKLGGKMARCFISIEPPEKVRVAIGSAASKIKGKIKAVEAENIHITLLFLGEIDETKIRSVEKILSGINIKAFEIEAKGISFFGAKYPKIAFVNISDGEEEICCIWKYLYEEMKSLGMEVGDILPPLKVVGFQWRFFDWSS
jgi:2'-5' RNA ligase